MPLIKRDRFRAFVVANLPVLMFLAAYFLTVVIGNFIYASSLGSDALRIAGYSSEILDFDGIFSVGYWVLLLMPFLVTPLVAWITRICFARSAERFSRMVPEITPVAYTVLVMSCVGFVVCAAVSGEVVSLFGSGVDARQSVEVRFEILERLGFPARVAILSLLYYLAIYAIVRWAQCREIFWAGSALLVGLMVAILLTMLNMKWPVLVFNIGVVLTVFVYASRRVYLKTAVGVMALLVSYWLISNFVFRVIQVESEVAAAPSEVSDPSHVAWRVGAPVFEDVSGGRIDRLFGIGRVLVLSAFNRMAVSYPYYYEVFTFEGAVCGGLVEQAQRRPNCRPSTLIYSRVFGEDGFEGRGTSPAAVHISAYAVGGWPLAVFALLCASAVLGLIGTLPLDSGATVGSFAIVGAVSGYHFSQLPGEGPIFYDHGLFWVLLMIGSYIGYRGARRLFLPAIGGKR